jgi:hypothetical protein
MYFSGKQSLLRWNLAAMLLAVLPICASSALAQSPQRPSGASSQQGVATTRKPSSPEYLRKYNPTVLKTPVELPGLPSYSGQATFMDGFSYPNAQPATISMRFSTKEDASEILAWYKQAFGNYNWKLMGSSSKSVTATKDDASCYVRTMPTSQSGYKTEFLISYSHGFPHMSGKQ